ncbi:hypothetical protein PHISCL_04253 [Aspergillus sclerotialis]|uniref:Cupin domain protein n=1 Tax=Aspergillus sclerotialis TaxID=2070753 RepID=A0A3A3A237_9EURO|nr:hypothetical protein PHISCL_04253 [Aspergillus sclerotialis]
MKFWSVLILSLSYLSLASKCTQYLTATAIVEDANGTASIECWKLTTPFHKYPTTGMSLPLGDVSNITYVALPPRSGEGIHNPPHPMLFVLLSGLAHVTLPDGDDEAWIVEGVNGLLVAADANGVGHYTDYPSDKTTIALQVPFSDGVIPEHTIVHSGACQSDSQVTDCDEDGFREEL